MSLREYEKLFKAISDKQRLRILALLMKGPLVVNDIKTVLHLSMSTVSQHLAILREANWLIDTKQGRWVIYSINPELESSNSIAGILYRELKHRFDEDESLKYDRMILEKIHSPGVTLRDQLTERPALDD
ncbi:MAG: metalloregulator ArsR/SmtB family transcription factor [Leptospiraceae bacterium]|nr:metalloregulator ArsR/SmtB family transcription factor [Leptospiraceae bacterium]MDW8306786.1 metalloregulator ArsR/SmtB family transcription factor [Leptospiraceae bacterium]